MSYSIDLKKRVLGFIEEGGSKVEATKHFSLGRRTIFKWINKKREEGTLENKKRISSPRKLQEEDLKKYLRKHPDHYLREIAIAFKVTPEAVFYACRRWSLTYKKTLLYKERDENLQREFQEKIQFIAKDRLVFLDESGIDSFVSRDFGRTQRGEKIQCEVSGKRYTRKSFIAAKIGSAIIAPMIFEGTCNSELFETWIEKVL